jgi:hypothetical protein
MRANDRRDPKGMTRPTMDRTARRATMALAAATLLCAAHPAAAVPGAAPSAEARRAAAHADAVTPDARELVAWVAHANDHGGSPFVVVDKRNAAVLVFDGNANLVARTPVLLGLARGDDSVPGIGERKISEIRPAERTTPAGRFVGEAGRNLQGEDIVWVDYDDAISMHRVRASNPREHRLDRLATPTIADNRISYGCINVPAAFYDRYVSPIFAGGRHAIIYVMPETRPLVATFPGMRAMTAAATPATR